MASGLSIGDDYCSALSVHGVNRAFDDRHWGVPKFSIGLKSGLTSGQGFTFASLCSRKSLVYFAVCTQVLSCLISGFGGKMWHNIRLKNTVDIGQLLHHSLNLDQYVETQWCQVFEQVNALDHVAWSSQGTPFFHTIIEIAFSLYALNSLLVWKTGIRNLRWYSATCHAVNSVEL